MRKEADAALRFVHGGDTGRGEGIDNARLGTEDILDHDMLADGGSPALGIPAQGPGQGQSISLWPQAVATPPCAVPRRWPDYHSA
jgi:hypothetical protein